MTEFTDQFGGNASTDLYALHGETVAYTPKGGEESSITGDFTHEGIDTEFDDGESWMYIGQLKIKRSDVASPGRGDKVTINSAVWKVSHVRDQDDIDAYLEVKRKVRKSTHRPGHTKT